MISKRELLDGPVVPLKRISVEQIEEQFQRLFIQFIEGRSILINWPYRGDEWTFNYTMFCRYAVARTERTMNRESRRMLKFDRGYKVRNYLDRIMTDRSKDIFHDALIKHEWLKVARVALRDFGSIFNDADLERFKDKIAEMSAAEIELVAGELVTVAEQANALKEQVLNFEMAA